MPRHPGDRYTPAQVAAEAIACWLQVEGIGILARVSHSPEEQAELTADYRRARMELVAR